MDSARLGDLVVLSAEQLAVATEDERAEYEAYVLQKVVEADEWDLFVQAMWPEYVPHGFAPHHEEFWAWVWSIGKGVRPRPFVGIWPRGHGKCQDKDAVVELEGGGCKRAGDVRVGDRVVCLDESSGRFTSAPVTRVWDSGVKPVLRLTTRSGSSLRVTAEHKVLTWDGWREAGDVRVGDRVAAPRSLPGSDRVVVSDAEVKMVGYLTAEGSCGSSSRMVTFTNADRVVVEDFKSAAAELGLGVTSTPGTIQYRLLGGRAWVERHPSMVGSSLTKRLPPWVFGLPVRQKWLLLATLIDTDGWVAAEAGQLGITLANGPLVSDIRRLFLQVGVVTTTGFKSNGHAGAWHLIVDQDALGACVECMPLVLKGDKLVRLVEVDRYSLTDTYPGSVGRNLPFGVSRRLRRAGVRIGSGGDVTRRKLRRAIACEPLQEWVALEQSEVMWDQVVEVVADGDADTCDFEVAGHHNMVSNLLVAHNSTTVEMAVTALAARGVRAYCLYVSEKQDQADDHVQNIAALLESPALGKAFPAMGRPLLNKMGQSKGWRRNRVRTESGFTVDAIGFDTAARGVKLENQRPDIIVLDDIDGEHDTLATARKKVATLTTKFIPSGSSDVAYIAIQNLIIDHGVFGRLCGRFEPTDPEDMELGKFLRDKIVCGPVPSVEGLVVEDRPDRYVITEGTPTWPEGKPLEVCEAEINDMGLTSFNAECQHKAAAPGGGMFDHLDWGRFREGEAEVPPLMRTVCWLDPAVTSTNRSDNCGVVVTGIDAELRLHVLWAWEGITGPMAVLKNATRHAVQFGCDTFGVESNQGGDTWEILWRQALTELEEEQPGWLAGRRLPRFRDEKASEATGGKVARARQMLATYEQHNRIKHVEGTGHVLEAALHRFPRVKPYDLVDAAWWAWWDLTSSPGGSTRRAAVRSSARDTLSSAWG